MVRRRVTVPFALPTGQRLYICGGRIAGSATGTRVIKHSLRPALPSSAFRACLAITKAVNLAGPFFVDTSSVRWRTKGLIVAVLGGGVAIISRRAL